MPKFAKVLLTSKEVNLLINDFIGNTFMELGDEGEENSPYAKQLNKLEKKVLKAYNKTGVYYTWQLKDRDGETIDSNIKEEYL